MMIHETSNELIYNLDYFLESLTLIETYES